jgi:hypothetical protein
MGGCTSTPVSLAISLAGDAVNDADVQQKSQQLMGVSTQQCDAVLGQPFDIFDSQQPQRQWRTYRVKDDVLNNYRYIVEFDNGTVIAVSKAQKISDAVLDAATYAYFKEKCMGQTPAACEQIIGRPPALTVKSELTGQVVQLYDARLVKQVQKPFYGVLRFGPDGTCSQIGLATIAASTTKNLTGQ